MTTTDARVAETVIEVNIEAAPDAVWTALTNDIGKWWPSDCYAGGTEGDRNFILEARPGGRMFETWGSGDDGLMWGTVHTIHTNVKLEIVGVTFPQWGGPNFWTGAWDLEADGESTKLRFTEATVGKVEPSHLVDKEKGWTFLFGRALKAHCEGKDAPSWE